MMRFKNLSCAPLFKRGANKDANLFHRRRVFALLSVFLLLSVGFNNVAEAYEKMVFGVVEKVTILPEKVKISAKLDTGAKTSSLGVTDMKIVTEDNHKWVYFAVNTKNQGKVYFKRKLEGYAKIKTRQQEQDSSDLTKDYISRPVVLMDVRLGERQALISVNLANRQNFLYTFLLGRAALTQLGGIIDPSQYFTQKSTKLSSKSSQN